MHLRISQQLLLRASSDGGGGGENEFVVVSRKFKAECISKTQLCVVR